MCARSLVYDNDINDKWFELLFHYSFKYSIPDEEITNAKKSKTQFYQI
jgi:hypothetical protein